jgi:threonine dehydrogenase-like Zn-dependent dehydrogenase
MTIPKFPTHDTADPITGEKLPVTMGHEFSGTIVEVGPGVRDDLKVGTNVAV